MIAGLCCTIQEVLKILQVPIVSFQGLCAMQNYSILYHRRMMKFFTHPGIIDPL